MTTWCRSPPSNRWWSCFLTVINRPNHGVDRQARALACECLREVEKARPSLLSEIGGHLWSLCQNERTQAAQSYILLFTTVVHNIVVENLSFSILNTAVPLVPFSSPQNGSGKESLGGLNYKELLRAKGFLLEWPQVLTPCAMVKFLALIMPMAAALELQISKLKVQFFGMLYSSDPMLCHIVLTMFPRFWDAFDGQEGNIARRLVLLSKESQHHLVFRLLAVHWLLGFGQLVLRREVKKVKTIVDMGSRFYPSVFDPLALKALKLDLLAFCFVCVDVLKPEKSVLGEDGEVNYKLVVRLFEDELVCVSAFKWLPPGSTETAVAFRTLHRFLIGASSHSDNDPSTTRSLMDSTIFRNIQIIRGQLHTITVGIEDMFLKAIVPPGIQKDSVPGYYLDLFSALWVACGISNTARETFQLKGGKGVTAISGTRSVKLLEVPASSLIQATERYLAPFVVSVIGEPLVTVVKDGGIIRDIIWKDEASDSSLDITSSETNFDRGPLHLTFSDDADERDSHVNTRKRNMGSILILIFLPPRYHLLFQMEVSDVSSLVRIQTDHWPCLAYTDDYLEALFLA